MACDCHFEARDAEETRVLRILFLINAVMFASELVVGIIADSTGVMADSLDMLADALVYGISLYAVGKAAGSKILAARFSGFFQIAIAMGMMVDISRRILGGSEPHSLLMMAVSTVALVANIYCLKLISRHREGGVHMRASWIFSKNDVIANLGVIVAGILVAVTGSRWPDIIIGGLITMVVLW
ncbi:MAG: cation transporter, partial [Verrucomicrobiaceae bacterium]